MELTILMPCLNEAETIAICVKKAMKFLTDHQIDGEVLIADNGSTDNSQQIAIREGARVVPVPIKGYGAALLTGIQNAKGKYVIMGDSDDSYDFSNLDLFVEKLREGYALVMGNRFKGGIEPGAMPPLHQYLGNPLLSGIGKIFYQTECSDFHCGLRGFNRQAILDLDLRTTGMEFASEMVIKATLEKLRICEIPTKLYPDGRSRPPHLRSWSDGWRHLRFMLIYCPRWLFFYPGIAATVLGGLGFAFLINGPKTIGKIVLETNSLLFFTFLFLIGLQAVTFAIYTKIFGISQGFLPIDKKFIKIIQLFKLEHTLIAGFLLILIGIIGFAVFFFSWVSKGAGTLETVSSIWQNLPFLLSLYVGSSLIFNGFFMSIMTLKNEFWKTMNSELDTDES